MGDVSRLAILLAILSTALLANAVSAQPVLHEQVPLPSLHCQDGVCRRDGPGGELPDAVVGEDGIVGAPLGSRMPGAHEQVFTPTDPSSALGSELLHGAPPPGHDPPPQRRTRVGLDADTGPEPPGERVYHEVFNPAVFPYKRMSVLDAVDENGALYLADSRLHELVPEGSHLTAGRDPFYGSVVVDFIDGKPVPLPTPAAGVRLLSYQGTPELPLRFFLDGADNLYALAARGGRHRLVYLVDASQRYFAGSLFAGLPRGRTIHLDELPTAPRLPRNLRKEAEKVLRHIGVRVQPSADYGQVLSQLVGYFRDFEIAELPGEDEQPGSLYLRIALSQRGVCRHRSYAFLITALAAGIPTRYVENELHVFVEVYIPAIDAPSGGQPGGWRRINLGGAPLQQRVFGGENRTAYQEKGGDPFNRPQRFSQGVSPQVAGLPQRPPTPRANSNKGEAMTSSTPPLPALDGPEDRARREGKAQRIEGSGGASAGANGGAGNAGESATSGTKGTGANGSATSGKEGAGASGSGSAGAGRGGKSAGAGSGTSGDEGEAGEVEAAAVAMSDDIDKADDARAGDRSPALETRISVYVGAARRIYRGTVVPVRGQVQVLPRGAASDLEVLLLLALPSGARLLGRTMTHPDGSYAVEVEIPPDAPLGLYQLVARVRGDESRRGSSSGRYDHIVH